MKELYHYTSIDGLIGIIQYRKLWLSSIANMNDHQEVIWLKNKFYSRLKDVIGSLDFEEKSLHYINQFLAMLLHPEPTPYICCFSRNGDLLSQWRAYSSDGEGACIKFNIEKLGVKQGIPYMHPQLEHSIAYSDVIYEEEQTEAFIATAISKLIPIVSALAEGDESKMLLLSELANQCSRNSFIYKNSAFSEEQEIRIVHTPFIDNKNQWFGNASAVKFRQCSGSVTSYFEYEFSANAVDEIILGPKCKCSINELNLLLRSSGYQNVKINKSSASYR